MDAPSKPRRFYLITHPRTASNLLVRILALDKQPGFVPPAFHGGYFFMPAFRKGRDIGFWQKQPQDWTQDDRRRMQEVYQECFDSFQGYLDTTAAQGKTAFVKEHTLIMLGPTEQAKVVFGNDAVSEPPWTIHAAGQPASEVTHSSLNPTLLSDEFLKTFLPTFLIRHPALAFPSVYRARTDVEGPEFGAAQNPVWSLVMTLRFTRIMYDFYSQYFSSSEAQSHKGGVWPVMLDADDIINNRDVLLHFCELVGFDQSQLQFEWDVTTSTDMSDIDPKEARMLSTLSASVGIDKSKTAGDIDINAEAKKWKEEFGEAVGAMIEKHVREAMPDYEFLRSKSLKPKAQPTPTAQAQKDVHSSKESASADSSASSTTPAPKVQPNQSRLGFLRKMLPCIPSSK